MDKKELNKKFISFLDQVKDEEHKSVTRLNDRVLIVDGLNTFIRSFSVNPAINDDGLHIGGMIGFLKSLRYTCDILKPSRCIIVFDGKNGSARRQKIYPEYKATRKVKKRLNRNVDWGTAPQDEEQSMIQQMGRLVEYLEQLPLTLVCVDGIEADDGMAYISQQLLPESDCILMSTDKDFLQLVDDRVHVWNPTKRMSYNPTRVMEEYNMPSHNFTIYRALDGDKSDNIKGIPGIGLKTLQKKLPMLFEDKKVELDDLIKYAKEHQDDAKVLKNIAFGEDTLYLNYVLMQLHEVDISGNTKMNIMRTVREEIPTLVKYKIHKMVVEDKLWSAIPNVDNWLQNFVTLNKYADLKKEKNG